MKRDLDVAADTVHLWPDGRPDVERGAGDEIAYVARSGPAAGTTHLRNISDPTLSVFPPANGVGNGIGVIVAPGGAWVTNVWAHQGLDVARWLAASGCTAFLLKYRVQASTPLQTTFDADMAFVDQIISAPLATSELPRAMSDLLTSEDYHWARAAAAADGRQAVALTRQLAELYPMRVDTIGMIGFSAGAFLAVDVATDPTAERLDFLAAIYGGETLGAVISADAPPLFAAVAADDILRLVVEGLYRDWSEADRPSELHVFRGGGHGFGVLASGSPSDQWTDLFMCWLHDTVGSPP